MTGHELSCNEYIIGLLKFTTQEHVESILDGKLYCNTINYFRRFEQQDIGDKLEASGLIKQRGNVRLVMHDNGDLLSHIFCMTLISSSNANCDGRIELDYGNLKRMGDKCILITDFTEFLNRVKLIEPDMEAKYVRYYTLLQGDQDHVPYRPYFQKKHLLKYQNEFRLFFRFPREMYPPEMDNFSDFDIAKTVEIGSIRNIAECFDTEIICESLSTSNFQIQGKSLKRFFDPEERSSMKNLSS